jgi:hypothetical protein
MKAFRRRPPTESDIEARHRQKAISRGWYVEKVMSVGRNGFPDRFYAKDGRIVLIEWKRARGGVLDEHQRIRIGQLKAAGVEVHVVRSIQEASAILGFDNDL